MNVLGFAASNSKQSINKQLVGYATSLFQSANIELIDINDFEMPLYSVDREQESGTPQRAKDFIQKIDQADIIVVSLAEYNGSYTAAFKNLFDWASRVRAKVYENKQVVFLSTSPGPNGAQSVLASAVTSAPYFGATVVGSLSVPSFYDTFDVDNQALRDPVLVKQLEGIIDSL
ncbi:NADPH-dependent FMN reductase [Thaumasiovibrio sp. DFM-14]|uniref:NADPH-dependent FMN reductase n=1 Tax=Thaumasiovibrio sp. DFM-14 TaxID=3384792 RepID=UPI00399F5350